MVRKEEHPRKDAFKMHGICESCGAKGPVHRFAHEWRCDNCLNPDYEQDVTDFMYKDSLLAEAQVSPDRSRSRRASKIRRANLRKRSSL